MQTRNINTAPSSVATPKPSNKPPKPKPSKGDKILTLLRRPKGASIAELSKASGWQPHSVRGYLSGTLKKRKGLTILTERDRKGVRRYILGKGEDL